MKRTKLANFYDGGGSNVKEIFDAIQANISKIEDLRLQVSAYEDGTHCIELWEIRPYTEEEIKSERDLARSEAEIKIHLLSQQFTPEEIATPMVDIRKLERLRELQELLQKFPPKPKGPLNQTLGFLTNG